LTVAALVVGVASLVLSAIAFVAAQSPDCTSTASTLFVAVPLLTAVVAMGTAFVLAFIAGFWEVSGLTGWALGVVLADLVLLCAVVFGILNELGSTCDFGR
jgi:hypothetical protein